ncbi:MAG: NotI family restriction endonuclease [Anaerolineae bacterium]
MPKFPSEIFGHPYYATDPKATADRRNHWCPFVDRVCYKRSRLVDYPFGACSCHSQDNNIAICPRRFLDQNRVFADIAEHHFGTLHDILVFPEVGLSKIGNFDFVMVRHKPLSAEIEDFAVIEFQTGQTTSTGALVQGFVDFMHGEDVSNKTYQFGLNTYDIWKRTFTQILNKGVILESWGHKIYWVVQEHIYDYFATRYNLQNIGFHTDHSTVFALYDLKHAPDRLDLVPTRMTSATIDQLFAAFRNNPNIPPLPEFVQVLQKRVQSRAQLSLQLDQPDRSSRLDVHRSREAGDADYAPDEGAE